MRREGNGRNCPNCQWLRSPFDAEVQGALNAFVPKKSGGCVISVITVLNFLWGVI